MTNKVKISLSVLFIAVLIIGTYYYSHHFRSDADIIKLLKSKNAEDLANGARLAGNSGKKKFVPYLLSNSDDGRIGNMKEFHTFTVYSLKMYALSQIYKREPPVPIDTFTPDSTIIKFYITLSMKENKKIK